MERGHTHVPGDCKRIAAVLSRIGDKWTILVVALLSDGPLRFNEIRKRVGGISQRMLTLTLRALERDGFVTRTVFPSIPPRVDYELTPLGRSLLEPVQRLGDWAMQNIDRIEDARRSFDAAREVGGSSFSGRQMRAGPVRDTGLPRRARLRRADTLQ
ncbi:helix-turn-helix transcriptional regulator [Methylosinus sp. Sm6]|nr:helix-turn-helix transcriptional regulator [Methylosinus sp. Sm6]